MIFIVGLIVLTGSSGLSKKTTMIHIVPVGAGVGPAHLVWENAASGGIDSVWLVNHHVDLDTYWTV